MSENHDVVGYFNLEKQKDPRLHVFGGAQLRWIGLCTVFVIGLSLFPWAPIKLAALIPVVVCLIGLQKGQDGLKFRTWQTSRASKKLDKKQGIIDIEKAKEPPIGLGWLGIRFPQEKLHLPASYTDKKLSKEQLEQLRAEVEKPFELGAIYNKGGKTITTVVTGSGTEMALADSDALYMHRLDVAEAIREVALTANAPISFSLIFSSAPANTQPYRFWREDNLDPDVLDATPVDPFDIDAFLNATVEQRQRTMIDVGAETADLGGSDATMAVAMTINKPKDWKVDKQGNFPKTLTPRQVLNSSVAKLTLKLEDGLEAAGIADVGAVSAEDMPTFIRSGLDVLHLREWQQNVADIAEAQARRMLGEDVPIPEEMSPWPDSEIRTGKTPLGHDWVYLHGTYHHMMQSESFTRLKVFADDFLPLFDAKNLGLGSMVGFTAALCGDIVDVATEEKILTRGIVLREALRRERRRNSEHYEPPSEAERRMRLNNRQQNLYHGGALALSFNVFFSLRAVNEDLLDEAINTFFANAGKAGTKVRHVEKSTRQIRALMTGTLGVSMADR